MYDVLHVYVSYVRVLEWYFLTVPGGTEKIAGLWFTRGLGQYPG